MWAFVATWTGYAVSASERGAAVRLNRRDLAVVARETLARATMLCTLPLGLIAFAPVGSANATQSVPVLLVADRSTTRHGLVLLQLFLQRRGWRWVWAPRVPQGSLAERGEALGTAIDDLLRQAGGDAIDLVGHGAGGLVAAWHAKHGTHAQRIRRVVTIGTPWGGTRTAVFRRGRLATDLVLGAPALDALLPLGSPTTAIWSPTDPEVVPPESARPRDAHSIRLDNAGHLELLFSPRAFRAVQAALSTPGTA
jgi:triacylglycerol esterase/lipase EstA (alpha/beta hydrolase family)